MSKRVFAVAAHPDDIEFLMAGTLILLKRAGYEVHLLNIANGSCGSSVVPAAEIVRARREEAIEAALLIGAVYHESLVADIDIFYEKPLLARVAAIMREVAPEILLVQSPSDYMEDHQNAARLAVTAAFCRGMPNFPTDPPTRAVSHDVTVYHAQPHGNLDPLRGVVRPDLFVDISSVLALKREMLSCHQSQKRWLDESQGMDSYLHAMEGFSREVGGLSGRFACAEGWRRRLHLGFCGPDANPLAQALPNLVMKRLSNPGT
jgi:LmbE family N-acetylglucosaminyl deacetylase